MMSKFLGFDGVRAIACLLVILHHATQRLSAQAIPDSLQEVYKVFIVTAPAGVSVFFVLSGALLSYPFWKSYLHKDRFPNIKDYALRRAARIMPGYYLALIIAFSLEQIILPDIPGDLIRFFSAATFTSGFYYMTLLITPMDGPLWTISFEVFSYVLLPIFMMGLFCFCKKRTFGAGMIYWLGALAFIFFINSLVLTYCQPDDFERGWQYGPVGGAKFMMPNFSPWGMFAHYSLGIIASGIMTWFGTQEKLRLKLAQKNFFDILAFLGLVAFVIILYTQRNTPDFGFSLQNQPYFYPSLALSIAVVLAVAPYSKCIGNILDNRFFQYTAKISFGLYIYHFLVMTFFDTSLGYSHGSVANLESWSILTFFVILVTYIVASLSWYFVEKPILDIARKRKNKNSAKPTIQI